MPRVKRGVMTRKRHRRIIKRARGYWGARSKWFKMANEAVMHAGQYAYRDRRKKKRDFRRLWIARINGACRERGMTYSRFMNALATAGVTINRKALADLALYHPEAFDALVTRAKDAAAPA